MHYANYKSCGYLYNIQKKLYDEKYAKGSAKITKLSLDSSLLSKLVLRKVLKTDALVFNVNNY